MTTHMKGEAILVRIFIGENDKEPTSGKPLYEAIVLKARELHMAGATVVRGVMGFGKNSHLHSAKVLRLSGDLPIVVEIVDRRNKIDAFLPWLDDHVPDGLVTTERVDVLHYRTSEDEE